MKNRISSTALSRYKSVLETIILSVIGLFILCAPYNWLFSSYLIGGIGGLALVYGICFGSFSVFRNQQWRRYAFYFVPLIALYLLTLIGMLYTDCPKAGSILENNLSFIVFPAIFLLLGPSFFTLKRLKILGIVFYASCLIIIILFMAMMFLAVNHPDLHPAYAEHRWLDVLDIFSHYPALYLPRNGYHFWVHHTFQCWYMLTAMSMIVYTWVVYPEWYKPRYKKCLNIVLLIIFIFGGILLSLSKMGYLVFAFWCVLSLAFLIYKRFSVLSAVGIGILLTGLVTLFFIYSPRIRQVVETSYQAAAFHLFGKEMDSETWDGSVAPRIMLWRESVTAIKAKPLFGWGTGAEWCVLSEYSHPHNQWLLDGIRFGLIGILALAWLFYVGFRLSYKSKNGLLALFMILTFCFSLTDRNLDFKIGIIFFGLLYGLFVAFSRYTKNGNHNSCPTSLP